MEAIADEEIQISELPQTPGWILSLPLNNYQGFWYPERVIKGVVSFQKNFIPQPADIFLCSHPKCGSTWLKALLFAILNRTNGDSDSPLLFNSPHDLIPFIEILYARGKTRDHQNPLVHTHVPFSCLPKSTLNSNSKLVYICRDPKDVLVSYFFFTSTRSDVSSFEEVHEMFCKGISGWGPFWDHVLGYWKASLEFPERILFLKYEDLKNNTRFYVKKMADFMGYGFSMDEETNGTVNKIVEFCSFENLSNLEVNKSTSLDGKKIFSNASLFRKGEIGDWKNYLTPQMAETIDQITYQKFSSYGLNM